MNVLSLCDVISANESLSVDYSEPKTICDWIDNGDKSILLRDVILVDKEDGVWSCETLQGEQEYDALVKCIAKCGKFITENVSVIADSYFSKKELELSLEEKCGDKVISFKIKSNEN